MMTLGKGFNSKSFPSRPLEVGKGRTYMRKRYEVVTEAEWEREWKAVRKKRMGRWTEKSPHVYVGIAADAQVKNRNESAGNRRWVLIGWKKVKNGKLVRGETG